MNRNWASAVTRRPLIAGLLGALGLGIAGGLVYEMPRLLRRRHAPTPYDDLLSQIDDRESAAKLGSEVLSEKSDFDALRTAQALRRNIGNGSMAEAAYADIVNGKLEVIGGWLLPKTLVELAGLAAKFE